MTSSFQFLSGSLALENRPFHFNIANIVQTSFSQCSGYIAYKLTTLGRASDEDVPSFIIVTKEHGVILLDIVEDEITEALEQDGSELWKSGDGQLRIARSFVVDLYSDEVISRLKNDISLYNRKTKSVKVPIISALVFCKNNKQDIADLTEEYQESITSISAEDLQAWLNTLPMGYNCSDSELGKIYSLLEGTFIYESKQGFAEQESLVTVNDYIQKSLKSTFKQDDAQRLASLQLPPGPQRIRGLAGTGKTIVLCLKAAITHKRFSNYKILYLFNTQSLYHHVQNLISKYYTLEAKRAPDFENSLHVLHAWGGKQKPGLYSQLCNKYGLLPLTLSDARGKGDALEYVYKDLLQKVGDRIEPEYDLILIDEAQDFPDEVFQVVFKLAKGTGVEKRIIWAYDEFQSLRNSEIKEPEDLFGKNAAGEPNIPNSALDGKYEGNIPKDFVLPNCYRTPRPVLLTAHGVAMSIYTSNPTTPFAYKNDWNAIGYRIHEPQSLIFSKGDQVKVERPDENSKNLLETILNENQKNPRNLIQAKTCVDQADQLSYIREKVHELIFQQGVSPEEIIIVNLHPGNNKESMLAIQRALAERNIQSVLPGYVESADVFKPKGFVTITTPYRAKGNEANIVFVLNAQNVVNDFTLRMRNAFFVAVTRSRGWCYISGIGPNMSHLEAEINAIKNDFPFFNFEFPDPDSIRRSKSFLKKTDKELDQIQNMLALLKSDPELRQLLIDHSKDN
ncbi:DEAD/DEAH box helicase [Cellvibrio sp. UBA7671]|uniref:DEAD/DEAH box helicase n=1 Tax=Cellvibrio sp. UBA7671 TaxID=1946312 RepID=UPI002F359F98